MASALDDPGALFQGRPLGAGTFDVQYTDPGGMLHYGLQDEETRVNLNTAPVELLAALPGMSAELAEVIIKQRQQAPWGAPEELVHRGLVSAPVWYGSAGQAGLHAYLTVWGSGKININTASPVVMAAVPGMTPTLVEAMMRYRQGDDQQLGTSDDRYFRTLADLATLLGVERSDLERTADLIDRHAERVSLHRHGACARRHEPGAPASAPGGARAHGPDDHYTILAAARLGHLEKQAMQSGTAQQVMALLQAAGVLTPEAAAQALVQEEHTDGNLLQTLIASGAHLFCRLARGLVTLWSARRRGRAAYACAARCPGYDCCGGGADG